MAPHAALADRLTGLVGGSLRVATYAGDDHDVAYFREDIEPKADADRSSASTRSSFSAPSAASIRSGCSSSANSARHFEEGVVFHVAGEAYTGVFVSVDADAAGEGPAIIDSCRDYIEGGSADDRRLMCGAR